MARRGSLHNVAVAVAVAATLLVSVVAAAVPPSCERIECPAYEVVDSANGFEIRQYTDAMWTTTAPIDDISFVAATRTGFLQLFDYIQGKNAYNETIEMTAPVLTRVSPSDGPFCASSFTVSFYVPAKNQAVNNNATTVHGPASSEAGPAPEEREENQPRPARARKANLRVIGPMWASK